MHLFESADPVVYIWYKNNYFGSYQMNIFQQNWNYKKLADLWFKNYIKSFGWMIVYFQMCKLAVFKLFNQFFKGSMQ